MVVPPLALSSMLTLSKPQRQPDGTEISPAFKVPQGRRAVASWSLRLSLLVLKFS